jgi:hypothetical protein
MTEGERAEVAPRGPASPQALLAVRLGAAMAGRRLVARRTLLVVALGVALTITSAVVERSVSGAGAVDRALVATFRLVLPLVAFALCADAAGREHLRDATWPVARFGVPRRDVALGVVAAAALACAACGALLAAASVLVAHTAAAPPLARDLFVSAWIGALSGAAYAGWFSLGGTFLRRGRGRIAPLVADLLLGGSTGVAGVLLPRGSAMNLLGGPAPLGLTQQASAVLLACAALTLALIAALRCRE